MNLDMYRHDSKDKLFTSRRPTRGAHSMKSSNAQTPSLQATRLHCIWEWFLRELGGGDIGRVGGKMVSWPLYEVYRLGTMENEGSQGMAWCCSQKGGTVWKNLNMLHRLKLWSTAVGSEFRKSEFDLSIKTGMTKALYFTNSHAIHCSGWLLHWSFYSSFDGPCESHKYLQTKIRTPHVQM